LENKPFDLKEVINRCVEVTKSLIKANVTLEAKINLNHNLVIGDYGRLAQCINCFLSNAAKFTHSGKVLFVVKQSSPANSAGSKQKLEFEIHDTGVGMSLNAKKTLFHEFSPGETDITRRYGGAGLGLAVTKPLIKNMGGDITEVQSEEGKGTSFHWFVMLEPFMDSLQTRTAEAGVQQKKVLVVEDNILNQIMLQKLIQKLDYKCEVASDGAEALKKATENRYGLILMDLQMPVMGGLESATEILRKSPKQRIVALTANADDESRTEASKVGMVDFVPKPVTLDRLKQLTDKYL
jgi:CheY-like chemotaxis protein